jgi:hypothetical protein
MKCKPYHAILAFSITESKPNAALVDTAVADGSAFDSGGASGAVWTSLFSTSNPSAQSRAIASEKLIDAQQHHAVILAMLKP